MKKILISMVANFFFWQNQANSLFGQNHDYCLGYNQGKLILHQQNWMLVFRLLSLLKEKKRLYNVWTIFGNSGRSDCIVETKNWHRNICKRTPYFVASNLQKKYGFLEEGYKMIAPILHELQKYLSTHTVNKYRNSIGKSY